MESIHHEVRFDIYCKKCKNETLDEYKDPCNECLDVPYRAETIVPLYFEEKTN